MREKTRKSNLFFNFFKKTFDCVSRWLSSTYASAGAAAAQVVDIQALM